MTPYQSGDDLIIPGAFAGGWELVPTGEQLKPEDEVYNPRLSLSDWTKTQTPGLTVTIDGMIYRRKRQPKWRELREDEEPRAGDVARGNGREFPVLRHKASYSGCNRWFIHLAKDVPVSDLVQLGFTFWRYEMEERTPVSEVCRVEGLRTDAMAEHLVYVPLSWPIGAMVRVTRENH